MRTAVVSLPVAGGTTRRGLLAGAAALAGARVLGADGRPPVTAPRATSFDARMEPAWAERFTVTVGPGDADIVGTGTVALQAAVDHVAGRGGGTVKILPGRFVLRAPVVLRSGVRLEGAGDETVLTKLPSHDCALAADSDWYDQEVTFATGHGFRVGDAVCLRFTNPHNGSAEVLKRVLVARSGDRFKLDRPLRENIWEAGKPRAWALFPLVTGEEVERVAVERLQFDGDRANNAKLDGNHAGCIFLQDCRDVVIRDVTARNYNGDGISWQICHDVIVEDCRSHGHAGLGLHPGSGSQRPLMRRNDLRDNDIGLFFCWGVRFGLAEANRCHGNRVGISIGHRDTDNLVRGNHVEGSRDVGLVFRPERGPSFCGHRNLIEANEFVDNGGPAAAAVDVQGGTEEVTLRGNRLHETRGPAERAGIRLGPLSRDIRLADNAFAGFARDIVQLPPA
jgi:hypothetical protein